MWICGAAKTLAWDYAPGVPQGDAADVRVGWREKPVAACFLRVKAKLFVRPKDSDCEKADDEKEAKDRGLLVTMGKQPENDLREIETDPEIQSARKTSGSFANFFPSATVGARSRTDSMLPATNASHPPLRELLDTAVQSLSVTDEQELELVDEEEVRPGRLASLFPPLLRRTFKPLSSLFTPITISMYIAVPISLIPQLKALFVEVDGGPSYRSPDGNPPLTFIITTGKFLMCIFWSNGYLVRSRVRWKHECPVDPHSIGCFIRTDEDPASIQQDAAACIILGIVLQTRVAPCYRYTSHARTDSPRYCTQGSSCRGG